MAYNPFIGQDQAWLEKALKQAQDELATGKSSISGAIEGVSWSKIMTIGPTQRIAMILGILSRMDPVKYPAADVQLPTRTIMTYGGAR